MSTLMFYDKPVGLNREKHKNTKIAPSSGFMFAAKTNSIVLTSIEFIEAAKEYPIVFAKVSDDAAIPVALVGLRNDENLFVDADGKWDARYIPAFVRRYPFVLAEGENKDQFTVCVDEAYPGLGETDGQPLFDEKGENTPFLQSALDFLNNYQAQFAATQKFVKTLQKNDLLEEISAKAAMASGENYLLKGLLVVNEKKLHDLGPKKIFDMFQSNDLAWIYAHLMSLGNMSRLVDKIAAVKA